MQLYDMETGEIFKGESSYFQVNRLSYIGMRLTQAT
jgi:hypothetical protein